jgi:Fe2+ transport system protein FeoA
MALGLLEGTPVAMLRRALGGDPLEIDVMGYALSLRQSEARQITINIDHS